MRAGQSLAILFVSVCLTPITLIGNAHAQIDPRVTEAVGEITTDVQCPQSGYIADGDAAKQVALQRSVRITYSKPGTGYQDAFARQTLLYAGQLAVWNQCPVTTAIYGVQSGAANVQDIGAAEIYGSPTDGASVRLLLRVAPLDTDTLLFNKFQDVYAAEQQQAAQQQAAQQQAAAQAQAAQEAASQAQQQAAQAAAAEQAAAQQAQIDEQNRERAAVETARRLHELWVFIQWCIPFGIALLLFSQRETLARWYYYFFHPHPATPLVRAALSTDNLLDGKALARALSEVPPGSAVFRAVRLEQAEQLFRQMQAASVAHLRRQEQQAKTEAQRAYERAALNSIQEAVALAAVALERAKALYRASQQVGATS
jgi:hypothetical protein